MLGVFVKHDKLGSPRLVVVLKGLPCSYGKCRFCPFGLEQGSLRDVIWVNREIVERAVKEAERLDPERVSIFNGGSFQELPLLVASWLAPLTRGRVVDVESIPGMVTMESVESIYRLLQPRRLVVRVGFEVYDEEVRRSLGKGFPNTEIHRLSRLREELRSKGIDVEIVSYVLFGIEGVDEGKVVESVEKFSKLLDGAIAVKYHRYLPSHPREARVSRSLAEYLERNALYVDWGDKEWEIAGIKPGGDGA